MASTEIMERLSTLRLPAKAMREVLAIIAEMERSYAEEAEALAIKRERDRIRKKNKRDLSADIPRKFQGHSKDIPENSADIPSDTLPPEQKGFPITLPKTQPLTQKDSGAREIWADFLKALGADSDDPTFHGWIFWLERMLRRGFRPATILEGAAKSVVGKSKIPNQKYIEKVIENLNEERSSPAKPEVKNATGGNVIHAAGRLSEHLRAFNRPAPAEPGDLRLGESGIAVQAIPQR